MGPTGRCGSEECKSYKATEQENNTRSEAQKDDFVRPYGWKAAAKSEQWDRGDPTKSKRQKAKERRGREEVRAPIKFTQKKVKAAQPL